MPFPPCCRKSTPISTKASSGCSSSCASSRSRPIPPTRTSVNPPPSTWPRISPASALRPASGRPRVRSERLFEFLRIQSISTDPAYKDQCQSAAEYVAKDLSGIGFKTSIRPTEGHPIVVGKGSPRANGKAPRVLFYGHYDVQPVDPLDLWETPPFAPRIATLPDGRKIIVARGACDDKGQVMTFIEACRAFTAVTGELPLPITMMIEGEEECGSNHLFGFVKDNADEFKLDLALVCDTSMWDPTTPMVTTSLRGLVYEEV